MRRARVVAAAVCAAPLVFGLCGCDGGGIGPLQPTPSRIAFSQEAGGGRTQIFTMYTNGAGVAQLTGGRDQGSNSVPSWGPDGRICFCSDRDGVRRLYIMNGDGSGQERLTRVEAGEEWTPDWCPTGDKMVFARWDGGWDPFLAELYIIDLATRDEIQLTSDGQDLAPSWSPDGRFVAFSRGAWPTWPPHICVIPAQAGQQASFLTDGWTPEWSPSGDRIAYGYAPESFGSEDIYYIPVNPDTGEATGDPVQLTHEAEWDVNRPTWSPDEQYMAFYSGQLLGPEHNILKINVETGKVQKLRKKASQPDWSPVLP